MASSFLKGLVTDYGKLGYQLWHRPLKMASLVYEREIGVGDVRGAVRSGVHGPGLKSGFWGPFNLWDHLSVRRAKQHCYKVGFQLNQFFRTT